MTEQLALFDVEPTPQDMVREFHEVFRCPVDRRALDVVVSRIRLVHEEYKELLDELQQARFQLHRGEKISNLHKIAKELSDLLYVVYGTGVSLGIDLHEGFKKIHESNMSKLGEDGLPIFRPDGKVLKGEGYVEPDMTSTVREI